jgi:hypothetical protein
VEEPARETGVPMVEIGEDDSHKKSRSVRLGETASGKAILIKNHMTRDDQAVCGEIKTLIAFVIGGVV